MKVTQLNDEGVAVPLSPIKPEKEGDKSYLLQATDLMYNGVLPLLRDTTVCKPTRDYKLLSKKNKRTFHAEDNQGYKVWLVSEKKDGRLVRLFKQGDYILWRTAGGLPFTLTDVDDYIREAWKDISCTVTFECTGKTDGNLGDRRHVGCVTSWVARGKKGLDSKLEDNQLHMIDLLYINCDEYTLTTGTQPYRFEAAKLSLFQTLKEKLPDDFNVFNIEKSEATLSDCFDFGKMMVSDGKEGAVAVHMYFETPEDSPRSPYQFKIKPPKLIKGKIIDVNEGAGKMKEMMGSLTIQVEGAEKLHTVNAMSGWSNKQRRYIWNNRDMYYDRIMLFKFESFHDTFQQVVAMSDQVWDTLEDCDHEVDAEF